ncbi:MAG: carbohydrate kinase family protein [Candidatus Helarchaeota archaeon]
MSPIEKIYDCCCLGSSVNDLIIRTSALKQMTLESEIDKVSYLCVPYSFKVPIDRIKSVSGGSALNTACTLSKLGLKVAALSKVGKDQYGDKQISTLKRFNVDTSGVIRTEVEETGISIILSPTWGDRDRSILVYHGASDTLTTEEINNEPMKELIEKSKWLDITSFTSEMSIKALEDACKIARDAGTKLMIAPSITMMSFSKEKTKALMKLSDYLAVNKDEGEYLFNTYKSYNLLNIMYESIDKNKNILGDETVISITDGGRGSYARYKDEVFFCETYKIEIKNTTGAGDAFSGGFLYALLKNKPIDEILKIATAVAAHKIQFFGVRKGLPNEDELLNFLELHKDEISVYKHFWKEV